MRSLPLTMKQCLCLGLLALTPVACSDDDKVTVSDPEPTGDVMFTLEHKVGDADLVFDEMNFMTAAGNEFEVSTLQYYISDIKLMNEEGATEVYPVHYVDGRVHTTHTFMAEDIPTGHYHMVSVTFGLDEARNVSGALTATPENQNMEWPNGWGGGYHYMKLEGKFQNDENESGFNTHAGRYHSEAEDRLNEHHFFTVTAPVHRNVPEDGTLHIEITMDLLEWYDSPNTIDLSTHGAIMANFDKQVALAENGADGVFSIEAHGEGGHGDDDDHDHDG